MDGVQNRMSYALLMYLPSSREIVVGALGKTHFKEGWYVYVGSGDQKRIERHFRDKKDKKNHWHIDYFLQEARPVSAYIFEKEECSLARGFKRLEQLPFGASDCKCKGHLFHGSLDEIERMALIQEPTREFKG